MGIKMRTVLAGIVIGVLLLSGPAWAGEGERPGHFYMGLGYGTQQIDMETRFVRDISGTIVEDTDFDNSYSSKAGGLFLGYSLPWKRCYLNTQLHFNISDNEFDLSAGSSRFTNSLDQAYGVDLMPGFYIYKGLSVYGKIGLTRGEFSFVKSSPSSTTYDVNTGLNGYTLGGGLAYDITPRFTVRLTYEQIRFKEKKIWASINFQGSTGEMNDFTQISPKVESISLTLQYNFQ